MKHSDVMSLLDLGCSWDMNIDLLIHENIAFLRKGICPVWIVYMTCGIT